MNRKLRPDTVERRCGIMKKLTLNDMKDIALERGGLCLSGSYDGSKSKLHWRCGNGHEWKAVANSVKSESGTWCRQCAAAATASKGKQEGQVSTFDMTERLLIVET